MMKKENKDNMCAENLHTVAESGNVGTENSLLGIEENARIESLSPEYEGIYDISAFNDEDESLFLMNENPSGLPPEDYSNIPIPCIDNEIQGVTQAIVNENGKSLAEAQSSPKTCFNDIGQNY